MIVAKPIVLPREEITRRPYAINQAGPIVARLQAVVVREAEEEPLLLADDLVKAVAFRVKSVGARVTTDEIVPPLGISRLVGRRIELQISFRNRADQLGWNNVIGKRRALNARANLLGGERVKDLEA